METNTDRENKDCRYPIGGYAPGTYSCICTSCKCEFMGDKRAVQCEPCAIKITKQIEKCKLTTIKSNELRLGNLIFLNEIDINTGNEITNTINVNVRDIWNLENGPNMLKNKYSPIPLTEEWLKKFGFEPNGLYCMGKEMVYRNHTKYFNIDHRNDDAKFYFHDWEFRYVHQLENLYFALTGEELV